MNGSAEYTGYGTHSSAAALNPPRLQAGARSRAAEVGNEWKASLSSCSSSGMRGCTNGPTSRRVQRAGLSRRHAVLFVGAVLLSSGALHARSTDEPGRSIGRVSVKGKLIVVELSRGALGRANLFDLTGRTLRFTTQGSKYRIEKLLDENR
jgi:hypothetical protein